MAETQNAAPTRGAVKTKGRGARRLIIRVVILLVVVLAAVVVLRARQRPKEPEGLTTAEVKRAGLVETVSATGSVTAQTGAMVKIGSQITGRIKHLYADVGSKMKAGQMIAELDVPDLRAQVEQAEATLALNQRRLSEQLSGVELQRVQASTDIERADAGVATAQAAVRQAQANQANSDANLRRQEELFEKGYVAASDVDNARAQAKVNEAQVASALESLKQAQAAAAASRAGSAQNAIKQAQVQEARQAVRQSQAALDVTRSQLDKAYIRTPISGTVLQLAQQEGETIAAGLSAPTLIIVADLARLQVDAFVDETDIGKVELGQPAKVTVDAYPDRKFPGTVQKIASGATMQQNVVTYDVTIDLENPKGLLKPDMTATVDMEVVRRKDVLTVPVDAIKPSTGGDTVTVLKTNAAGEATYEITPVTIGISDGDNTEILSGLKEGDVVVLSGEVPGMNVQAGRPPRFGLFGPVGGRGGAGGRGGSRGGR